MPLVARDIEAGYEPWLPIVRAVSMAAGVGEIVAILGPNGAGKSTFAKALAGLVPVFGGTVHLAGTPITGLAAHKRVGRGLGFVPQTDNIFATLSIEENLKIAATVLPRAARHEAIAAVFHRFQDLAARPSELAGRLSGGQRQMLAVGRALIARPTVLILDEPSAGLSPKLVAGVFDDLKAIAQTGVTILLVEQNVRAALAIANRAVILAEGVVRRDSPVSALDRDDLGALFLGAAPAAA